MDKKLIENNMEIVGIEPTTFYMQSKYSTNWVISPKIFSWSTKNRRRENRTPVVDFEDQCSNPWAILPLKRNANNEIRTHTVCLEGRKSTINLYSRFILKNRTNRNRTCTVRFKSECLSHLAMILKRKKDIEEGTWTPTLFKN